MRAHKCNVQARYPPISPSTPEDVASSCKGEGDETRARTVPVAPGSSRHLVVGVCQVTGVAS